MKPTLNIICPSQFGYLVDTYEYCKNLKSKYHINYICLDHKKTKMEMDGVEVTYISVPNIYFLKWFFFSKKASNLLDNKGIVFIKYFRLCSLIKFFSKKKIVFVLDIRTGSISPSRLSRFIFNKTMALESVFFEKITIISESLAQLLKIKKYTILPLGTPSSSSSIKNFNQINLLYIGTLSNRSIEDTIIGLKKFIESQEKTKADKISYNIIGDGYGDELDTLRFTVNRLNLNNIVKIHGRIPYDQLTPYYEQANIGISYIPITPYYDVQPVTKTFEYIANGMPVIGTKTKEQAKVINSKNGILCEDTPESFAIALEELCSRIHLYSSSKIINNTNTLSWTDVSKKLSAVVSH